MVTGLQCVDVATTFTAAHTRAHTQARAHLHSPLSFSCLSLRDTRRIALLSSVVYAFVLRHAGIFAGLLAFGVVVAAGMVCSVAVITRATVEDLNARMEALEARDALEETTSGGRHGTTCLSPHREEETSDDVSLTEL